MQRRCESFWFRGIKKMLKNFKTVGIKIIYWCLNSLFIFGFANQGAKKWNMTVGMLGALFSCNFSTISVAALCQAVLWVDHCGGGRTEINMNYHHNLHCTPLWCRYIWIISAQNLILLGQKDYSNLHSTNMYSPSVRRSTYVVHTPNIITFCIHWSFQHQHQRSWCV